ncbi:MAG: DUF2793 domain-containing protein [Rhizobiaceae bacterium]|nr:DUF2793 domain-containing protein [Rhizobiaceae bacterium]
MVWSYTSPVLGMPYLLPSQAQKHVTVNEALGVLDALAQLSVKSRLLTAPPGSPAEGDRYVVAAPATGAWTGREDAVAAFMDGGWRFHLPREGYTAWVTAESALIHFDGSDWQDVPVGAHATLLGINATADATNRLAVSSPATLFSHEGAGHQAKINKAAAGDTASLLFQTGMAGRGEIGLLGNDDLGFKVHGSDNVWRTALTVDRNTAAVTFPGTVFDVGAKLIAHARDVKTSGTDGGTFTSGARRTRDLNTLTQVVANVVSLSSNQLTIAAGSYAFRWSCPAYRVGGHRSFLRDVTNGADLGVGSSETSAATDATQTRSLGFATATLAGATVVRLEHRSQQTLSTSGFGLSSGIADEVYSTVEVWRI